ncbi:MAG: HIT family protein [Aquabacterium sp.]|jgi:diadenosine tetraphosphate (Ap4A) HIT family hydrolase|uniref:HIT family protein n=1 Tax=Aquabacterium sp. TaxID=1872578 RepID=UPI003BAEC7A6
MGQLDTTRRASCELCEQPGGVLVVRNTELRVIRVNDALHPGFYRVIWNDHVAEFSDLPQAERMRCMDAVALVESLMRMHLQPIKVNLASLGNMVPHLHWHLIARYRDDPHFPQPIWATQQREAPTEPLFEVGKLLELDRQIQLQLG